MTKFEVKDVTVKCKNCGRSAKASEFVLDHVYKMMVCPMCVKERQLRDNVHKEIKAKRDEYKLAKEAAKAAFEEKKKNIPGWDEVDEMLERAYKFKMSNSVRVEKISDEIVRYKCPKCGYVFKINVVTNTPSSCPYCSAEISKFSKF